MPKKPIKKPSIKPRKSIIKSQITKQNVKQIVNVNLPSKRTYTKKSGSKVVEKTIVQQLPSMVQPVYVPQPNPFNFNDYMAPINTSIDLLIKKMQTQPIIKETVRDAVPTVEGFNNVNEPSRNENFSNQLENTELLNSDLQDDVMSDDNEISYLYKEPKEKESTESNYEMTEEEKQVVRDQLRKKWGDSPEQKSLISRTEKVKDLSNKYDDFNNLINEFKEQEDRKITSDEKKRIAKLYPSIGNTKNLQVVLKNLRKERDKVKTEINLLEKDKKGTKKAEKKLKSPVFVEQYN